MIETEVYTILTYTTNGKTSVWINVVDKQVSSFSVLIDNKALILSEVYQIRNFVFSFLNFNYIFLKDYETSVQIVTVTLWHFRCRIRECK